MNKFDKLLAGQEKQIGLRFLKRDITADTTDTQRIIRDYFEKLQANKLGHPKING